MKLVAAIFGGALYGGGVLLAQYYPCDYKDSFCGKLQSDIFQPRTTTNI